MAGTEMNLIQLENAGPTLRLSWFALLVKPCGFFSVLGAFQLCERNNHDFIIVFRKHQQNP